MDQLPAIYQALLGLGGSGVAIAFLVYKNGKLEERIAEAEKRIAACQEAHLSDVRNMGNNFSAALTSSTEVIRHHNGLTEKFGDMVRTLTEAVKGMQDTIERLDETLGRRQGR